MSLMDYSNVHCGNKRSMLLIGRIKRMLDCWVLSYHGLCYFNREEHEIPAVSSSPINVKSTFEKQASRAATYIFSFFSRSFLFSSSCCAVDLIFTRPCCQKKKQKQNKEQWDSGGYSKAAHSVTKGYYKLFIISILLYLEWTLRQWVWLFSLPSFLVVMETSRKNLFTKENEEWYSRLGLAGVHMTPAHKELTNRRKSYELKVNIQLDSATGWRAVCTHSAFSRGTTPNTSSLQSQFS